MRLGLGIGLGSYRFLGGVMPLSYLVTGSYPAEQIEDVTGQTVDFGAGLTGYAIQQVGSIVSGTSVSGYIEQSANGVAWSALSGAEFTEVVDSDQLEQITITPTQRYVRWRATITGVSPGVSASALVSVLFARC